MSSLAAYLAKNYLTADTPDTPERPKKKRKKTKTAVTDPPESGLIIADDDPPDLRSTTTEQSTRRRGRFLTSGNNDDDDNDEGYTIANAPGVASFKKKTKSGWSTIQPPSTTYHGETDADADAADAILRSAAHEHSQHANPADDAPTIEAEDVETDGKFSQRMSSGALAGLQTAEQTASMMAAQKRKKEKEAASTKPSALESRTIYRDASGRIINVSMARAQARRAEEEKVAAEKREREAAMGDVQRREKEGRRKEVDEAKFMSLARGVEDAEMNRELRDTNRWNDPAAAFLSSKKKRSGEKGTEKTYKGAAPPNRYKIRPGHRWDGVDRSTGFERRWFEARNKRERVERLEYEWQMDE